MGNIFETFLLGFRTSCKFPVASHGFRTTQSLGLEGLFATRQCHWKLLPSSPRLNGVGSQQASRWSLWVVRAPRYVKLKKTFFLPKYPFEWTSYASLLPTDSWSKWSKISESEFSFHPLIVETILMHKHFITHMLLFNVFSTFQAECKLNRIPFSKMRHFP